MPPSVPGSPAVPPATHDVILINEVLSNPQSRWNCSEPGATFSDQDAWVELYNPQNQAFNLFAAHAYLDGGSGTGPYYIPSGVSIAAHGFLVIFPRTEATFTLTTTLRLMFAGTVIDQVTIPELGGDQSYARVTDGASTWQVTNTPTIDASNNTVPPTTTAPAPSSSTSTGNQGNGSQNSSSTSTNAPVINGTQPAWIGLTLPTPGPTATAVPTTGASVPSPTLSSPPAQAEDDLAVPRNIALTLLVLALALTLFWCWRLFSKEEK